MGTKFHKTAWLIWASLTSRGFIRCSTINQKGSLLPLTGLLMYTLKGVQPRRTGILMQLKQGYRDSGVAGAVTMRISQTWKLSMQDS